VVQQHPRRCHCLRRLNRSLLASPSRQMVVVARQLNSAKAAARLAAVLVKPHAETELRVAWTNRRSSVPTRGAMVSAMLAN
jgi:hypothetical protein